MAINNRVDKEELINNYNDTLKNNATFRKLIKTIDVKPEIAMKYTSSLEETTEELKNCKDCPGLIYCKNRLEGHIFYPAVNREQLIFSYVPCHYTKEQQKAEAEKKTRDNTSLMLTSKKSILQTKKELKL